MAKLSLFDRRRRRVRSALRARAAGILQKRLFREGSDVKAGQALFAIDAAPYEAALQSARACVRALIAHIRRKA